MLCMKEIVLYTLTAYERFVGCYTSTVTSSDLTLRQRLVG